MSRKPKSAARSELAAFLRSRRARLSPREIGLKETGRRRTPGLRREEVAQAAGVGLSWYTWLEQGRDIEVSAHFLERIAFALRLDEYERGHLFSLAQDRAPPRQAEPEFVVTDAHRHLLEAINGPAYICNARMDLCAWNSSLCAIFGDPVDAVDSEVPNMLLLMFLSAELRAALPNWATAARGTLARFRADYGRNQNDPTFARLIERLNAASYEFRAWWPEHDVTIRSEKSKRFAAPLVGEIELDQHIMLMEPTQWMRLIVYTPVDDANAQRVLLVTRRWRESSGPKGLLRVPG